jgi:hypothetical protein
MAKADRSTKEAKNLIIGVLDIYYRKRGIWLINIVVKKFNSTLNTLAVLHCEQLLLKNGEKDQKSIIKEFMKYAHKKLGCKQLPKTIISTDHNKVLKIKALGCLQLEGPVVWVYTRNRNTADILRTMAHEFVHAKQLEDRPDGKIDGSTGSDDENEANSMAAVMLREYGSEHPEIYD